MFLSKRANGFYYLFFEDSIGKRIRISTKTKNKSKALEFYKSFQIDQQELQENNKTLKEFTSLYTPYAKSNFSAGTVFLHELFLKQFSNFVGDICIDKITPQHIDCFKSFLLEKEIPNRLVTINIKLGKLKSIFNTAIRWGIIKNNPFLQIKPFMLPEKIPAYFTPKEFNILLSFIRDNDFSDYCTIAFYTGMRLSEIASLEWSNIDFSSQLIHIENKEGFTTKSKKNRIVPMNDELTKLLTLRKGRITDESGLVFHHKGKRYTKDFVTKKFKRLIKKSKLNPTLHFHSLRHSFCSNLVKNGVSLYQVQKLAGHQKASVTQIYSHLLAQEMHSVVNVISLLKTN